ncbi:glycoside hydrolase family 5 protein [Paenibacillus sp. FJAT-27812]|uniref:glycoside hydrolase family 5 protein n=1 Tax=Paenibacillus sp. FJAT-27812 TaxID=1684143 RepID=UPI0006A7D9EB|nr:glycoside hydrolase family 5 protein [Paenibacillus sp. FJAT-27812]
MILKKSLLLMLCSTLLLGLLFSVSRPTVANAAFGSGDFLKTSGTVLKNNWGAGSVINLRGTNLGGWLLQEDWMTPAGAVDEYTIRRTLINRFGEADAQTLINGYQDTWIQASDLDMIKNMGMNVVRVPLYWEDFMYTNGTMKPDSITFRKLDWLITQAGNRNLYVILDLHGAPGAACPWHSCGQENSNQMWTNATYQNWTVQIWERLATRYNNNPTVAAYDLLNEPLVTMGAGENAAQIKQKMDFFNRLYQAVRAKDPNHVIIIAAFFDWFAASPPSAYGWSNVMYQTHHYQFTDYNDWNLTNSEIDRWLKDMALYQKNWNVPVYAGEFSFGQNDLYEKWLNGLNGLNASWTNWSYKVKGGGNWGYYINNNNPAPNLNSDSAATIAAKWNQFATANFTSNTVFQNLVKKYTGAAPVAATWSSLKANANSTFVSADNAGLNPLIANRTTAGDWERFKVINNADGTISLLSLTNLKYVQADLNNGGRLIANASFIGTWEKFYRQDLGNGLVALKSAANNLFVCADLNNGNVLYANRTAVGGAWEQFIIASAP